MKEKLYKQPCPYSSFFLCIWKSQIAHRTHMHTYVHTRIPPYRDNHLLSIAPRGLRETDSMSSFSNLAVCMIFRLKMQDLLWAAHTNCCVFARFVTQIPEHLGIPPNSQMVLVCILHDDITTQKITRYWSGVCFTVHLIFPKNSLSLNFDFSFSY